MVNRFELLNPQALVYMWIPFAAAAAGIIGAFRAEKILARLSSGGHSFSRRKRRASGSLKTRLLPVLLIFIALLLVVFASARPSWDKKEISISRKGRDVVFVIDVSRSMLAEDLYPNRLERAKLAVLDALSVIDGDRVGLVAFAGTSVVKCPLTVDYSFFRQSVEQLQPGSVSLGGSMIGDALRKTLSEVLKDGTGGYRDIVLITDGEDQESYPVKAAETLGESNVRLIAVGLGDENTGKRIPVTDDSGNTVFLTYEGREVWSRLDADSLRKMAAATPGGKYLNVSTGSFDMGEIYRSLIKTQESRFIDEETTVEHEENFQYFLFPAVFLMMLYIALRYIRGRKVRT